MQQSLSTQRKLSVKCFYAIGLDPKNIMLALYIATSQLFCNIFWGTTKFRFRRTSQNFASNFIVEFKRINQLLFPLKSSENLQ